MAFFLEKLDGSDTKYVSQGMIPKELFEGVELIAATKGTKYQFSSLQKVERSFVKKFIKHYFVDLGTFKNKRIINQTQEQTIVFHGNVRKINSFEEFRIPRSILITELKSNDDER